MDSVNRKEIDFPVSGALVPVPGVNRPSRITTQLTAFPQLENSEFDQIQTLISGLAGVNLTGNKKTLATGRLLRRVRALDCSFQEYIDLVKDPLNTAERSTFVDLLTIHETFFFREMPHFDLLRTMASQWRLTRPMRFWSAACSSGEEAYSAAMVLHSELGPGRYEILATDVSEGTLDQAIKGLYPLDAAELIPDAYLKSCCEKGLGRMDGFLRVKSDLRRQIRFVHLNLLDGWDFRQNFDVIFLRNVMIYFDTETKRGLSQRMLDRLEKEGVLVVGHAESLSGLIDGLERNGQSVYRRKVS